MNYYYLYILASGRPGTLYTGITNDLIRRITEHKRGLIDGFTKRYKVDLLVYYEQSDDINTAIEREKQIKAWKRNWKIELIESNNPQWRDLYQDIIEG